MRLLCTGHQTEHLCRQPTQSLLGMVPATRSQLMRKSKRQSGEQGHVTACEGQVATQEQDTVLRDLSGDGTTLPMGPTNTY